jgi:hypothetical protein
MKKNSEDNMSKSEIIPVEHHTSELDEGDTQ